jgi:hypothetical protein
MTTTGKKYQPNTHGKIAKLIAERQADIEALQRAAVLLNGLVMNGKKGKHASLIAEALTLDEDRRETTPRGPYKKRRTGAIPYSAGGKYAKQKKSDRKRTAAFLAKVAASGDKPYTKEHGGRVSVLLQHGYLRRQGEGYVRTDKVFTP